MLIQFLIEKRFRYLASRLKTLLTKYLYVCWVILFIFICLFGTEALDCQNLFYIKSNIRLSISYVRLNNSYVLVSCMYDLITHMYDLITCICGLLSRIYN